MYTFTMLVMLAFPDQHAMIPFQIQSPAVYLSEEDCRFGMEVAGKVIEAGVPKGTRFKIQGSCTTSDTIEE